jgi:hypothetical protein
MSKAMMSATAMVLTLVLAGGESAYAKSGGESHGVGHSAHRSAHATGAKHVTKTGSVTHKTKAVDPSHKGKLTTAHHKDHGKHTGHSDHGKTHKHAALRKYDHHRHHRHHGRYARRAHRYGRYGMADGDYVDPESVASAGVIVADPTDPGLVVERSLVTASQSVGIVRDVVADDSENSAGDTPTTQTERFLKLKNATGEKLKVSIQFFTEVDEGRSVWVPANPRTSARALVMELAPGASAILRDEDGPIPVSRVRVWASGATQAFTSFRNRDLVVAASEYEANEPETFTHVFE